MCLLLRLKLSITKQSIYYSMQYDTSNCTILRKKFKIMNFFPNPFQIARELHINKHRHLWDCTKVTFTIGKKLVYNVPSNLFSQYPTEHCCTS